jgi:subtilisin
LRVPHRSVASTLLACALVAAVLATSPASARGDDRVRGSFLVELEPGVRVSTAKDIASDHGGRVAHLYDQLAAFAFAGPDDARARLARDPRVAFVEEDHLVRAADGAVGGLNHLERTHSYEADTAEYDGAGVTIAVIDTGVQRDHPAFHAGQVAGGKSCVGGGTADREGHGTHTAGNAAGRYGVAHDATIVPVRVFRGAKLSTPISNVVCGLNWVKKRNGASPGSIDVVNLSLAFGRGSRSLKRAVKGATRSGAVLVAAAGNNGGATQFPARYDSVIAVSALAGGNNMANFSAKGGEMTAPGVNITGPENGGGISERTGTSRSSPMVAGAAAIVIGEGAPPSEVLNILRNSGTCPSGTTNTTTGFCPGQWAGDDANAEPLVNAYCAGVLANPVDVNVATCGF